MADGKMKNIKTLFFSFVGKFKKMKPEKTTTLGNS